MRELHEPIRSPITMLSAYSIKQRIRVTFPAVSPYTDQSYKEEADINTIMQRYQSTGEMPVLDAPSNSFMDVSEMDFMEHMQEVTRAREMFAELPSHVRDRFANSPAHFLAFVSEPDNHRELAELGLLTPEATENLLRPAEEE